MTDELHTTAPIDGEPAKMSRSERRKFNMEAAAAFEAQMQREHDAAQIRALGEKFNADELAERNIALGSSLREFQGELREHLKARTESSFTPRPYVETSVTSNGIDPARVRHFPGETHAQRCESAYASGQFVRALLGHQDARAYIAARGTRAMAGGILSKGGATVPEEMSSTLIRLVEQFGIARQLCRVVQMGSDTLTVPRRIGGVSAYFVGENAQLTASDMQFDQVVLTSRKLATLTKISSELAEDSVIDLADMVVREAALSFASQEDACFVDGDGTSSFGGILGLRTKLVGLAGAVDAAAGHSTLASIDSDDLLSLISAVPEYARPTSRFLVSPQAKALVFDALAQAGGQNAFTDIGRGPEMRYLGYPIVVSTKMPAAAVADEICILFGDFSMAATMGSRRDIRVKILEEAYADYDQVGVICTERFDIVCHDLGDESTAGPVVGLVAKSGG